MNKKRPAAPSPVPEIRRCAIYTRKSTSAGLDQDFNSLDAQREACEQYISRQACLGWQPVAEKYDDGGFTGANLERPAFARLMQDIEAGKIDVVVVYKVDRLSRSLLDFAKVMDRFSRAGAAFVSVTQNFSTADAMGRLTLNMLMSFAEFEREDLLIERRDLPAKIAKLTGDGRHLADTIRDVSVPGKRFVEERFAEIGNHLGHLEALLAEVERELASLDNVKVEAGWVARCLANFNTCWDVLTPENRGRLIRALVHRIEVDEPANQVEMHVASLAAEVPAHAAAARGAMEASP